MTENISKRTYTSKIFDLGNNEHRGEFHIGHIHYKDTGGNFQDVDLRLVDQGTHWEMTKGNYHLYIAKDFDAPELLRYVNRYEGANHTIKFNAHSLWWADANDPQNERTKLSNAQGVTGTLLDPYRVRYTDAFGSGIHFDIVVRRHGVQKVICIDSQSDLGTPPYSNYFLIPIFTWDAAGLTVKASDLPSWDNDSYYESQEYFDISESNPAYASRILRAKGWDSSTSRPRSKRLKVIFEKKGGTLYQGKLITKDMLENAVFPIRADATTNYYTGAGDGAANHYRDSSSPYWSTAQGSATGTDVDYQDLNCLTKSDSDTDANFADLSRLFLPVDTSALDDAAIVTAATLKVHVSAKANLDNDGDDWIVVVQTSQPDPTEVTTADYDLCGDSIDDPTEGSSRYDIGSIGTGAYFSFVLNATGLGWVSKTGYTLLGLREGHDCLDNIPDGLNSIRCLMSENTGTSVDPYLEVTYTLPLTVAETAHSQTAGKITLTGVSSIVPAETAHSHMGATMALSGLYQLSTAETSHSHQSDEPALITLKGLTVADTSHSLSSDAIALTLIGQLAVSDSAHTHTPAEVALNAIYTLSPGGALHSHVAESIITTIGAALEVSGASHPHTAAEITLSIIAALDVAGAFHSHVAESTDVDTVINLLVDGGVHSHIAEQIAPTIIAQLVASGSSHTHSAEALISTVVAQLVASGSLHTHSAEAPTPTLLCALSVADTSHTLVTESITLMLPAAQSLVVYDSAHTLTSDLAEILNAKWVRIIIKGKDIRTGKFVHIIGSYKELD
jgi:hypothetical protein